MISGRMLRTALDGASQFIGLRQSRGEDCDFERIIRVLSRGNRRVLVGDDGLAEIIPMVYPRGGGSYSSNVGASFPNPVRSVRLVRSVAPKGVGAPLRRWVLMRDHYQCVYCRSTATPLHIDHIRPRSTGGSSLAHNLQVLCGRCNMSKGARLTDRDRMRLAEWGIA